MINIQSLPKELSSQQTALAELRHITVSICPDTGYKTTYQLPPEIPTTEIGSQVRPTRTSTPWTTTPKRPRAAAAEGSVADVTESQHWRSPVEQELAGVELGWAGMETVEPVEVATARREAERIAKALKNIVMKIEGLAGELSSQKVTCFWTGVDSTQSTPAFILIDRRSVRLERCMTSSQ